MSTSYQRTVELLGPAFDYFAGYEHGAVAPGYFWFRKRQKVLRLIGRHLGSRDSSASPAWRMADIGCGDGVDLYLIRKRLLESKPGAPLSFLGIDGNHDCLRICRLKKAHYSASDCEFLRCDLSKPPLPLADGMFDLVYCSEVLEHLNDPEQLLAEVRRILKPHGYFLMTTPNEPNLLQRSYWIRKRRQRHEIRETPSHSMSENGGPIRIFGHVSVRTIAEWEKCLSSGGFHRVDFERGALSYEVPSRLRGELPTGLRFCFEAVLDSLPKSWVRGISDELIALYRKSA
jgi:ubiquinone/menaquinone biosynthesis C-methylase UbiE